MARHGETRDRVLRTASALFQQQGYHGTGLTQVLAESGAPKGSLYFHFPDGKEQLAAESVTLSGAELGESLAAAASGARDARTGVTALGDYFARALLESDFAKGCPVATVALESAAVSDSIRDACDTAYQGWQSAIDDALRSWGVPGDTSGPLAALVLSSLQGALVLARVQRDVAVIRTVVDQVGDLVEQAAAPRT